MATCLDAAGVQYPKRLAGRAITPLEGRSLRPAIEGREDPGHPRLFWEHEGNQAVRERNLKLVRARGATWELYDLHRDRTELNNLASTQPETVARLEAEYKRWMQRASVLPWDEARSD
jgi:arylsulfatase